MPFIKKRLTNAKLGFGADLQELRELRGFSREALARSTGIHALTIAALEQERLEDLTDPEYAERHVRVIVRTLEGSANFYLEKYRALISDRGLQGKQRAVLRPRVSSLDFVVISRLVILAGFGLLILVIGGYVVWQARQMTAVPSLSVEEPTEGMHLDKPSLTVSGKTDSTAKLTINGTPVIVATDGHYSIEIYVPPGLSAIEIQASRRYSAPVKIERHVFLDRQLPADVRSTSSTEQLSTTSTTSTVE